MAHLRVAMVVLMVGCSDSRVSDVAEVPAVESFAATSITAAPRVTRTSAAEAVSSIAPVAVSVSNEIEPFRNPFAPPKNPPPPPIVVAPEPEPEPEPEPTPEPEVQQVKTPPAIRLLGFMNIGEPKVLVSFRDELETLAIGDVLEDLKVVSIESPELTMLFDEREIKLSLFDQAWQHVAAPSPFIQDVRGSSRPTATRASRGKTAPPIGRALAGASTVGPRPSSGLGPSVGSASGSRPPKSKEVVSGTRGPATRGLPNLPGLGSADGRRENLGGAGLSRPPELDARDYLRVEGLPGLSGKR